MSTLETQYMNWLRDSSNSTMTYHEWLDRIYSVNLPEISDDFQIGPHGAYEHVGNDLDLQYQGLLQTILTYGVDKADRTGTGTKSIFGYTIRHNMSKGFPLLTTKKMAWKQIVTELLWFLRGDTNIKFLVDNDCHIWNGDAYKNYLNIVKDHSEITPVSKEKFIELIRNDKQWADSYGELGPIYGKQWKYWTTWTSKDLEDIDQIANLINELKTNPDSRRLMVSAWNVGELDQMVLPPCHYGFQVYTRELTWEEQVHWVLKNTNVELENVYIVEEIAKPSTPKRAISLMWNQRSVDTFLGLPFNIASYGLLLEIIAREVNMVPDELIGNLGDVHIYNNHIDQVKEQINRTPFELPSLKIANEVKWTEGDCLPRYSISDFTIENYQSHPAIKAPLSN